jgi:hypothetical protein
MTQRRFGESTLPIKELDGGGDAVFVTNISQRQNRILVCTEGLLLARNGDEVVTHVFERIGYKYTSIKQMLADYLFQKPERDQTGKMKRQLAQIVGVPNALKLELRCSLNDWRTKHPPANNRLKSIRL